MAQSFGNVWKALIDNVSAPRFDRNIPKRAQGKAVIGAVMVKKTALGPIGDQFLVHVNEDLRRQDFKLRAHLIAHAAHGVDGARSFALKSMSKNVSLTRKRMIAGRGDFGQMDVAHLPGKNMPGRGNPNSENVVIALDAPAGECFKKLRMQWPSINAEDHFLHVGSTK